ncbi:Calycin [Penicillium concentricum]|uniref:Calycin n=1 Tax=Penicillium concentricum TaxID=293559 RepID=A0A9W9S4D9_9EURO|nr:Calycin [Penicillium concentricum]KAJ5371853.1 Calycin [Penicillium concentricum]
MSSISLRPPKIYASEEANSVPPNDFIIGTWHVTHSTLPLWKDKRNVNITYKLLPADSAGILKLDDLVQYQGIDSEKIKSVHGVDTPTPGNPGAWDWRGKGWLMIASSHWECLGFGHTDDENRWIVTYFAKTIFTPAGIDIYSRNKEGLEQSTVDQILNALKELGVKDMTDLANSVFPIPQN